MKRQKIRRMLLIVSLLLFPVTLYYFSPALIFNGAMNSVVNGSFITFCLMTVLSIPFGRLFCGYLCPAGGLQETLFTVRDKPAKNKKAYILKYVIWAVWLTAVTVCFIKNGIDRVDPLFETDNGISVRDIQSYVIYYGIICLIVIPALIGGKRAFCHYFCWMAPFMALGSKLRRLLHLPGLHIKTKNESACVSCGKCVKSCPMSIDVLDELKKGGIRTTECIQCGACADGCPKKVLGYSFSREIDKSKEK